GERRDKSDIGGRRFSAFGGTAGPARPRHPGRDGSAECFRALWYPFAPGALSQRRTASVRAARRGSRAWRLCGPARHAVRQADDDRPRVPALRAVRGLHLLHSAPRRRHRRPPDWAARGGRHRACAYARRLCRADLASFLPRRAAVDRAGKRLRDGQSQGADRQPLRRHRRGTASRLRARPCRDQFRSLRWPSRLRKPCRSFGMVGRFRRPCGRRGCGARPLRIGMATAAAGRPRGRRSRAGGAGRSRRRHGVDRDHRAQHSLFRHLQSDVQHPRHLGPRCRRPRCRLRASGALAPWTGRLVRHCRRARRLLALEAAGAARDGTACAAQAGHRLHVARSGFPLSDARRRNGRSGQGEPLLVRALFPAGRGRSALHLLDHARAHLQARAGSIAIADHGQLCAERVCGQPHRRLDRRLLRNDAGALLLEPACRLRRARRAPASAVQAERVGPPAGL
ncbi:MAG: hypothetical protein AVDCRST_MAG23-873, partial [uncultured Sphingosinicella sp.]